MSDEQAVLAPNATVVNNLPSDPPLVDAVFIRDENGTGYLAVRQGYAVEEIDPPNEGYAEHCFATLDELAAYLVRNHQGEAASIDVLVEEQRVFVYCDPKYEQPQKLFATMPFHPCFASWVMLLGHELSQNSLLTQCRSWRESLVSSDVLMSALGNLTVIGKSSYTSQIDETGATRLVSADDSKDLSVKIPSTISIDTPIYRDVTGDDGVTLSYECELFLSVDTDAPVTFTVDFPKKELIVEEARRHAANHLQRKLGDSFLVSVGTANHSLRSATPANGR